MPINNGAACINNGLLSKIYIFKYVLVLAFASYYTQTKSVIKCERNKVEIKQTSHLLGGRGGGRSRLWTSVAPDRLLMRWPLFRTLFTRLLKNSYS